MTSPMKKRPHRSEQVRQRLAVDHDQKCRVRTENDSRNNKIVDHMESPSIGSHDVFVVRPCDVTLGGPLIHLPESGANRINSSTQRDVSRNDASERSLKWIVQGEANLCGLGKH